MLLLLLLFWLLYNLTIETVCCENEAARRGQAAHPFAPKLNKPESRRTEINICDAVMYAVGM